MRQVIALLAVLVAALALAGAASAHPSAPVAHDDSVTGPIYLDCNDCSATYVVSFEETQNGPVSGTPYEYSSDLTGDISQAWTEVSPDEYETEPIGISGSYSYSTSEPGASCSGSVAPTTYATEGVNGDSVVLGVSDGFGANEFSVTGNPNPGIYIDAGTCTQTDDEEWFAAPGGSWSGNCPYPNGIDVTDVPADMTSTYTDDCSSNTVTQDGADAEASYTDSLTFTSGAGGSSQAAPGTTFGPYRSNAKAEAEGDMIRAINRSRAYCISFISGAGLLGAGVLTSALPGGAGTTLAVAGGVTLSAMTPLCVPQLVRTYEDFKADDDPPLRSIHTLAAR